MANTKNKKPIKNNLGIPGLDLTSPVGAHSVVGLQPYPVKRTAPGQLLKGLDFSITPKFVGKPIKFQTPGVDGSGRMYSTPEDAPEETSTSTPKKSTGSRSKKKADLRIRAIQEGLIDIGYKIKADGILGTETIKALEHYESIKDKKLPPNIAAPASARVRGASKEITDLLSIMDNKRANKVSKSEETTKSSKRKYSNPRLPFDIEIEKGSYTTPYDPLRGNRLKIKSKNKNPRISEEDWQGFRRSSSELAEVMLNILLPGVSLGLPDESDMIEQAQQRQSLLKLGDHINRRLERENRIPLNLYGNPYQESGIPGTTSGYASGGRIQDGSGLMGASQLMGSAAGVAPLIPVAGPFISAGLGIGSAITGMIGQNKAEKYDRMMQYNQYIPADASKNKSQYGNFNTGGPIIPERGDRDAEKRMYLDMLLQSNKDLDFVQRIKNPKGVKSLNRGKGISSTHSMAAEVDKNGQWYMFPTVVNENGVLVDKGLDGWEGRPKIPMDKDLALWGAKGGYKTTGTAGNNFNKGGSINNLNSDSVEILGKHGYDANKFTVDGKNIALTRGETLDLNKQRVMSDSLGFGKQSFADMDIKLKKARGKAEKAEQVNPTKETANTIKITKQLEDRLFQVQEELAKSMGHRNNQPQGYATGGYYNGGPGDPQPMQSGWRMPSNRFENQAINMIDSARMAGAMLVPGGRFDKQAGEIDYTSYNSTYINPSIPTGLGYQDPLTALNPYARSATQPLIPISSVPTSMTNSRVNDNQYRMAEFQHNQYKSNGSYYGNYKPTVNPDSRIGMGNYTNPNMGMGLKDRYDFSTNLPTVNRPYQVGTLHTDWSEEGLAKRQPSASLTGRDPYSPTVDDSGYQVTGIDGSKSSSPDTPQKNQWRKDMTTGDKIGLGASIAALGIKGLTAFKKPTKVPTRQDTTRFTPVDYRPDAALAQSDLAHRTGQSLIQNSSSFSGLRAGVQNLTANTQQQRSKIIDDYKRMQQQEAARIQGLKSQQAQYNIQQQNYAADVNAQNEAARMHNISTFGESLANVGVGTQRTLNQYKQNEMILGVLKSAYPEVYGKIMGGLNYGTSRK